MKCLKVPLSIFLDKVLVLVLLLEVQLSRNDSKQFEKLLLKQVYIEKKVSL